MIGIVSLFGATPVLAAESTTLPSRVQDIAEGADNIYGDGAPLEHVENPNARFQSGGINHTHQYIVANALTILKETVF